MLFLLLAFVKLFVFAFWKTFISDCPRLPKILPKNLFLFELFFPSCIEKFDFILSKYEIFFNPSLDFFPEKSTFFFLKKLNPDVAALFRLIILPFLFLFSFLSLSSFSSLIISLLNKLILFFESISFSSSSLSRNLFVVSSL